MPPAAHALRRPIRALPTLVANQIAAGEVVERPASVVKELVENALDAGANRIVVELEAGGADLIRVTDDGMGIVRDELLLAVAPHATSKIESAADLTSVATLGFRGEALASIASVSRLTITTRTRDNDASWSLKVEGSEMGEPRPAAGPPGTSIEARDLFFNTPARRAFLRSSTAEQTRCVEIVREIALAHMGVSFVVRTTSDAGARVLLELRATDSPRRRVLDVIGAEMEPQLLEVHADRQEGDQGAAVWGLIGLPAIARANHRSLRTLVNGRSVRDKTLQHAVREAYRGLIEPGRYPTAVLMIELPPTSVDVNVHPAKAEVRFRDQSLVHSLIFHAVRDGLQRADLTPDLSARPSLQTFGARTASAASVGPREEAGGFFLRPEAPPAEGSLPFAEPKPLTGAHGQARSITEEEQSASALGGSDRPLRAMQMHNSYIVVEDAEGLVLIDQHALHERVMFEHLLRRVTAEPMERQRLLSPALVQTSAQSVAQLSELDALCARIGLELAPMGETQVGVMAFPSLLFERGVEPAAFVRDLLDAVDHEGFEAGSEEALHEVLDMMACKAAVKAGDPLTSDEVDELLRFRGEISRSASCPHGRATTVRLSHRDLHRLFDRR